MGRRPKTRAPLADKLPLKRVTLQTALAIGDTLLGQKMCIRDRPYTPGPCNARVYGFHIHQGDRCDGTPSDPFAEAKGHYNPDYCQHPQHAGDLPPLFGNDGSAWCAVLTNRFALREVIGRTVICLLYTSRCV